MKADKKILIAFILNLVFSIFEIVGGATFSVFEATSSTL